MWTGRSQRARSPPEPNRRGRTRGLGGHWTLRPRRELPRPLRLLLKGLGALNQDGMQLVSYLLFQSGFTRDLIEMGYRDALAMEEELRAFIFDQPMETLDAPIHLKLDLTR